MCMDRHVRYIYDEGLVFPYAWNPTTRGYGIAPEAPHFQSGTWLWFWCRWYCCTSGSVGATRMPSYRRGWPGVELARRDPSEVLPWAWPCCPLPTPCSCRNIINLICVYFWFVSSNFFDLMYYFSWCFSFHLLTIVITLLRILVNFS